ncbi:heme A synthase [Aquitalea sp. FJL05]|uniref:COX15/CtaA family protein n=1 Tax=Aquitalea sp. FJL05 TaxID=2153366 RepID=UPI000F590507|nr:COX15/CtaA family protein [Aquitalea sp. FJL05]RQO72855.1 heme A synthase [Aquitalea sp. FJL05]
MRKLAWLALLLACVVLPLGAYVRLSDAGLGCPDWPGCYGRLSPAHAAVAIEQAMQLQPDGPVSPDKAWKEMLHRYLAGSLGLLILWQALQAWRSGRQQRVAGLLLLLLALQAGLGMLTVTMRLQPLVVTAHLLLGMSLLALLLWQAVGSHWPGVRVTAGQRRLAWLWLLVLAGQIALGGWVSSHQAALACQGFPGCNGSGWPLSSLADAFVLRSGALPMASLVAMHWLHRLGALLVTLVLGLLCWRLWSCPGLRQQLRLLMALALLQLLLGVANVLWLHPLPLALAHHVGAMLLLASSCILLCRLPVPEAGYRPLRKSWLGWQSHSRPGQAWRGGMLSRRL